MSNRKYFGIDGICGRVGDAPITPDFMFKLGWATGRILARHGSRRVIIGEDTRISGYMLESTLETDPAAADLSALFIDPIPTLAVAYLTRTSRAEAGVVASASRNPFYDNSVKFFSINSTKLPDTVEEATEAEIEEEINCIDLTELGKASRAIDATGRHIEFCKATFPNELNLSELKIMVDRASDATYHIAPSVLREPGADIIAINCEPNGIDVNAEVGATNVHVLQARVLTEKADLGVIFDGDGDRVTMVDHKSSKVGDDQIMYIIVCEGLRQDQLRGDAVDILMSNMGLKLALKQLRTPSARVGVGNRYVLEKMQEKGRCVGTKNSGHVILLDKTTADDDIAISSQVLVAVARNHMSLHDSCGGMKMFPQILVNVYYTADNGNSLECELVKAITAEVEAVLGDRRRVLLRKPGTEPLICVMVEDEDEAQVAESAYRIADAVKTV